jgi:plastocyanin
MKKRIKFIKLWILTVSLSASISAVGLAMLLPNNRITGRLIGEIELTSDLGSVQNLAVYLKGVKGIHDLQHPAAVLNQKDKVFVPHLLPVQKGQKVLFKNSDPLTHNVHVYWGKRSMLNLVQGIDSNHEWVPRRTGKHVILCNIHPEMSAFLLVLDHPFFTIVDPPEDSKRTSSHFKIQDVPEGTYTLVVVSDVRGKLVEREKEIIIKAGETNAVSIKF